MLANDTRIDGHKAAFRRLTFFVSQKIARPPARSTSRQKSRRKVMSPNAPVSWGMFSWQDACVGDSVDRELEQDVRSQIITIGHRKGGLVSVLLRLF
jgi:hypothetical protein